MKLKRSGKSPVSPWLPGHFFLLFHLYMILHVQNTAGASMTAFLLRISVHSVQYSGFVFTVWEVWVEYEGSRRKERFYVSELLRYISLLQLLTKLNVAWKRLGHPLEDPTQRHPGVMHTFRGSHWFFSGFPSMGASYFFERLLLNHLFQEQIMTQSPIRPFSSAVRTWCAAWLWGKWTHPGISGDSSVSGIVWEHSTYWRGTWKDLVTPIRGCLLL